MKRYSFESSLKEGEITYLIATFPNIKFFGMTKMNSFFVTMSKNRIYIGRTPAMFNSNFSFFCGKLKPSQNGTVITGRFAPPLKILCVPYLLMCISLTIIGEIEGLIGCFLLHLLQMLLLSINTQSKKDILLFITNQFNSKLL